MIETVTQALDAVDRAFGPRTGRTAPIGWRDWPAQERQAIEALCAAWWRLTLASPVDEWPVTGALAFLVPLTRDIGPWLEIWTETPGRPADLKVAELWREWGDRILAGELDISVYAKGPNIAPDLADWLLRHGAARLADGDLDELAAWSLAQLPLPAEERWR